MYVFESSLDTKNTKKYVKQLKKGSIDSIVEQMIKEYLNSSPQNKFLIKYRVQDILNDIKNTSILAIIISLIGVLSNSAFKETNQFVIIGFIIIYSIITIYFISLIKYYRVCKLYLEVIKDIGEGKIKLAVDAKGDNYIKYMITK